MLGTHLLNTAKPPTKNVVEYVDSAAQTGTSVSSMPTHAAGDLLIGFSYEKFFSSPSDNLVVPAGWTEVAQFSEGDGAGRTIYTLVGTKIAASASETSGTWTAADGVCIGSYRTNTGVQLNSDPNTAIESDADGGSITVPSVTVPASGALVINMTWSWDGGSTDVDPVPSGWTLRNNTVENMGLSDSGSMLSSWGGEAVTFPSTGEAFVLRTFALGVY